MSSEPKLVRKKVGCTKCLCNLPHLSFKRFWNIRHIPLGMVSNVGATDIGKTGDS